MLGTSASRAVRYGAVRLMRWLRRVRWQVLSTRSSGQGEAFDLRRPEYRAVYAVVHRQIYIGR